MGTGVAGVGVGPTESHLVFGRRGSCFPELGGGEHGKQWHREAPQGKAPLETTDKPLRAGEALKGSGPGQEERGLPWRKTQEHLH